MLSAAVVQVSAWQACNGTADTEKVHALTAVGMPTADSHAASSWADLQGAQQASPMEGVTSTMGWLGGGPGWPRTGRHGLADYQIFVSWYAVEM